MPTGCFCCASACVFHNWLQVINVPYLCGFRSWNTMRSVCSSCKPLAMSSAIVTISSSGSASPAKYRDKRHKSYLPGMFLHDKTSMMWGMRVNKHALSLCVIRKNASSLSTGARKYDLIILRLRPSMHITTAKVSSYSGFITGIHLLVVLPPSNVGHDLPWLGSLEMSIQEWLSRNGALVARRCYNCYLAPQSVHARTWHTASWSKPAARSSMKSNPGIPPHEERSCWCWWCWQTHLQTALQVFFPM